MPVNNDPRTETPIGSAAVAGEKGSRRVRLGDLTGQYQTIKEDIDAAFASVMARGAFILGPEVKSLEAEIAEMCGVAHGIGVNSGTDALLVSMLALGFRPGDEVITTPFTFFATAEAISITGATPVFADIDPDTFVLDPAAVEAAITPRTRAIVPVHLYGQAADMDPLKAIAEKHGLSIIEDAAQIIGGSYKGRPAGSLGDIAAFSFYPTKNLGAFGDAGMIVTDNAELAEEARLLRFHGSGGSYFYKRVGYGTRLDEMQAAFLRVKLRHLSRWNDLRRSHAAIYNRMLAGSAVVPPSEAPGCRHIYHQYTIRSTKRDALKQHLSDRGVDSGIYYPLALHLQEVYQSLGYKPGSLPNAEAAAREVLSLPVYPELEPGDIEYVANQILEFEA